MLESRRIVVDRDNYPLFGMTTFIACELKPCSDLFLRTALLYGLVKVIYGLGF